MKLSIIIPTFNESRTISKIIKKVLDQKLPAGIKKEVVIIDDGSTDDTLEKIKIFHKNRNVRILKHDYNQGKGVAVRLGFSQATGDILLIQDADLEYSPSDYRKLLLPIINGKAKVVYGTRLKNYPLRLWGKNKTPLPFHWVGNKFLTFFTNLICQSNITDMETCYKIISREVINSLNLVSNRFDIEPEITVKILKMKYKIYEVPIKVKPRTHKEGKKIKWTDGFFALWAILRFRLLK